MSDDIILNFEKNTAPVKSLREAVSKTSAKKERFKDKI